MTAGECSFPDFVRLEWAAAVRLAYSITLDRHVAEDLAQDAFVRLWPKWPRVRDENPHAYLRQVVVRCCLSAMRRRSWRELTTASLPERPDHSSSHSMSGLADRDVLVRALGGLPPRQRAVLVLRYAEDMSEEEVADVLGCSTGSVKTHASRGTAKLRKALTSDFPSSSRR